MDSRINRSGNQGDKHVDIPVEQEGLLSVGEDQKQVVPEQKDVSDLNVKDFPHNHDNVKEASLLQREVQPSAKEVSFGVPDILWNILKFLDPGDLKAMTLVSSVVGEISSEYLKSAEGKILEAQHYESKGELGKAMMIYAEYAAHYAPARERLEAFCLGCKVFAEDYSGLTAEDLKDMSAHELISVTGDVLDALGNLEPTQVEAALLAHCLDPIVPFEERQAVGDAFLDTMHPLLKAQGGSSELCSVVENIERLHEAGALTDLAALAGIDFKSEGLSKIVAGLVSSLVMDVSSKESVELLAKGLSGIVGNSNFSNEARRAAAQALTGLAQASEGYNGGLGFIAEALAFCIDNSVISEIQREELVQGLFSVINNLGHDVDDLKKILSTIASVGCRRDLPVVDILVPLLNKTMSLEAKANVQGASCDLFNAMVSLYGNSRLVDNLDELGPVMLRAYKDIDAEALEPKEKLMWADVQIGILSSSNALPEGIDLESAAKVLAEVVSDDTGIMKNQIGMLNQLIELYNEPRMEAHREQLEIALSYLYLGLDQDSMDPKQKAEWVVLQVRIATSKAYPEDFEKMGAVEVATLIKENIEGIQGLTQRDRRLCAGFLFNQFLEHLEGEEGQYFSRVLLEFAQGGDLGEAFISRCFDRLSSKLDALGQIDWGHVELRGSKFTRELLVRTALGLSFSLDDNLSENLSTLFCFYDFSKNSPTNGQAQRMTIALESLPGILMDYVKNASSEVDIVNLVSGIQTILDSKFSGITLQHKTELMRVLTELMPKVETPGTRKMILDVFDTQMHASMLYRVGKGISEGLLALGSVITSTSTDHLFQGEVDDYVGKDFAAVFFNMDMDTLEAWMDSGGEYYVALALENTSEYLDGLGIEYAAERNKVEATLIALGDKLLEGPHRNSETLRGAVSVQRHSIAQATDDIGVLDGQEYLDALEE